MIRLGLISDTHGLLRPEALTALAGVDRILHAGDIGNAEILARLATLAPVTAVRGNNDHGDWAEALPDAIRIPVEDVTILMLHDVKQPHAADGCRVVLAGHSHRPGIVERAGTLFVNPGSAGPRRFSLPITVGELVVEGGLVHARIVELEVAR